MGLGEIPLSGISRRKVARQLRQPAFNGANPINAFDFETRQDGKIYLMSYIYEQEDFGATHIGNDDFSPLSPEEIFTLLTKNLTRQPAVNVWYNLDFDANALIGTIFNERNMIELADTNMTTFTLNDIDYELTYINGKFMSIRDENRHTSTHFDIAQFFNTSLSSAAQSWLNIDKIDLDPTKAQEYDWKDVTAYAERDAKVTQKLWKAFVEVGEEQLGIPLGSPISTGYVAQNVVFDVVPEKPKWGSSHFQEMARKAYHGGRFEVYRRGFFDNVLGLDINSAYPFHMSQMPDLNTCNIQVIGGNISQLRKADWGFVTATVTTNQEKNIQPFAIKDKKVYFPALEDYPLTVTKEEFLFALDNDFLESYDIHKMGLVFEKSNVQRPFSFLSNWYDDRLKYKKQIQEKDDRYDKFQYVIKVIMNSVYGKTCQVTEKTDYLEDTETFQAGKHEYVTEGYAGDPVRGWYEGGDLLNPFYASYITANTRLQLLETAVNLGIEESVIMFATDCIMLEANDIAQSDIDRLLAPEILGKWDYDYEGSAFVVGSGVYDVFEDDMLSKIASRGFREVTKNYPSWREAAQQANGNIVLTNDRPAKFKEWLLHEGHPRPAEFFRDERTLQPNFDSGREWQKEATFDGLLSSNHGSDPLLALAPE